MEVNEEIPSGKQRIKAVLSYLWPFLLLVTPIPLLSIIYGGGMLMVIILTAVNWRDSFVRFHVLQAAILQIVASMILTVGYYSTVSDMRHEAERARALQLSGSAAGLIPALFGLMVLFAVVGVTGLILLYLSVRAGKGHWPKLQKLI